MNNKYFNKKIIYFPGKVGINTNYPTYELDVFGDINLTGNLRLNGKEIITELKEEINELKEKILQFEKLLHETLL